MGEILKIGMEHKKFAFDREAKPAATIRSGDRVVFETEDANCSLITKETDLWAEFPKLYAKGGGCNPVTGPVYVEGAHPGDCLSVKILRVVPGFIRNGGYTSIYSGLGMLQDCKGSLQQPLEPRTKICPIEGDEIHFKLHNSDDYLKLPVRAFVGTIGVAPKEDRRSSFYQGQDWCGNVDICDIRVGMWRVRSSRSVTSMPFRGMARSPDAHSSARGSWKYRSTWFPLKRCTIATGRRPTLTSGSVQSPVWATAT